MQKRNVSKTVFAISVTAAMVALSVVFCRFVGFSPENSAFRFEFGFLPIAFVAELFGPLWSGVAYLVADAIGSLFSGYAPNPAIAACKLLTGVVMGLFLSNRIYKKRPSLLRVIIAFSIIAVGVDFLLMSPILMALYGWTAGVTFGMRAINAGINLPIRILSFYLIRKAMDKPLGEFMKRNSKNGNFKAFANSFQAVTVPGLERISALLDKLGNPEEKLRFVHIAGTNGKGSVSANMACIFEESGLKTGKFISPNLLRVNERISINGVDISDDDMNIILTEIEPLAKAVEKEQGIAPTQFEIWCALAFVYFERQACDIVVLEVGLGGEFDATNVIKKNVIQIITRLGMDHTQYLGTTLSSGAAAKCGIIKKASETKTLVTVKQDAEAMAVIEKKCRELDTHLLVANPEPIATEGVYESFSLDGVKFKTGIPGFHQIENASLAILAAKKLGIPDNVISRGVLKAKNPARFEIIRENPFVIYDGGHNENGITALNFTLRRYFGDSPKTVVFACMKDKEIDKSLALLAEGDTEFIFTTVKDNPRAMSAGELKKNAEAYGFFGEAFEEIGDAYRAALSRGKLTVICGSLYLYKDFREFYDKEL